MTAKYVADIGKLLSSGDDLASKANVTGVNTIPAETGSSGMGEFMTMQGGMDAPAYGQDSSVDSSGGAAPPKAERGFIITMKLSTPSARGVEIVERFNDALKAATPTDDRPLEVRQAKMVRKWKIKEDPSRVSALVRRNIRLVSAKKQCRSQAVFPVVSAGLGLVDRLISAVVSAVTLRRGLMVAAAAQTSSRPRRCRIQC